MSILAIAAAIAFAGQASSATVDVARDELLAGRNAAAIATIGANEELDDSDPARLINLGVAHARQGESDRARQFFKAAMKIDDAIYLETADGDWIEARRLAARALAMLERGDFAASALVASR
ncbi:tetratricopeptide repeat protein [Qipengyuania sp. MTN3-11]|uniref:tetratricopeptide repeat protein n=1 Tax=Qipengyuania sp. MTN3-11 TaxID=3056557 RepID=UPI0036F20A3E